MNTPYLSREDHVPTTSFLGGLCGFDRVYLNGLEPGDLLVSHSPVMISNTNGLLAGLDERFTHFDVTRHGQVIHSMSIDWKTNCSNTTQELSPLTSGISELPIPIILMIVSLVYLAVLRRIRR